jgi:hypothetical protein
MFYNYLPGSVNLATRSLIPGITQRPWSDYYLDYMEDRDIYHGQDLALFVDAWLDQLWSTINILNISKATFQGWAGWRMGVYLTLGGGIISEIVLDVLILTTAITLIDPYDKHNWGVDDLARGVVENNPKMDWSKMTFGTVV